jgi:hypothetical protein
VHNGTLKKVFEGNILYYRIPGCGEAFCDTSAPTFCRARRIFFFIALKTSVPDLFTFNSLALKIAFSAP